MDDATKRKRSYAMGYLTSLCGPVVSFPDKQPPTPDSAEKYSYNGVVLPKLPEWDKTVYPYAVIIKNDNGAYLLTVLAENAHYVEGSTGLYFGGDSDAVGDAQVKGISYVHNSKYVPASKECFYKNGEHENTNQFIGNYGGSTNTNILIWTNFCAEYNGTVYMPASEPVPVYE